VRRNLLKIVWRLARGYRAAGMGLVGSLLKGCLDHGVNFRLHARADELIQDASGRVIGVVADTPSGRVNIQASCGVVMANGGFEWNEKMTRQYLPAPTCLYPSAPGLSVGDNISLAQQVGAKIDKMDMYWNWPAGRYPGMRYEGSEIGVLIFGERMLPHSLWVNARGERFCNESDHNVAFAFERRDGGGAPLNQPAWAILDSQYRQKYPILFKLMPKSSDPKWLLKADSLQDLAAQLTIDARRLEETVRRFNTLVRSGHDVDFGRGESFYERALGDTEAPHPNLGTVETPPFYAVPVYSSAVGTRGGPRTDVNGRVMSLRGHPIPGLFAAGNAAAGFCGPKIIGGITIPPAMTFARLAVEEALGTTEHRPNGGLKP
jgi:succinate dehydrogenase/fumarate reductase flavoprotein subunit